MSIGFFVEDTTTYKLSSTFKGELCTLITKKTNIHQGNLPKFQVALTVIRASMVNPKTKKDVRDACTAFELQVPVSQRRVMEELLTKVFKDSTSNELDFVYYKQRHVHHDVFYKAIQKQRLHEESY
jgi:replication-associated recombination protein RarA